LIDIGIVGAAGNEYVRLDKFGRMEGSADFKDDHPLGVSPKPCKNIKAAASFLDWVIIVFVTNDDAKFNFRVISSLAQRDTTMQKDERRVVIDVAIVELIASGGFAVCQDNRRGFLGFGNSNLDCKHDRFLQKHPRRQSCENFSRPSIM
jgi:hypothetical protein